jgi:uridine kinase
MNMWDKVFECCRLEIETKIAEKNNTCSDEDVFLVVIDGMCGSGKSSVAKRLQEYFGCSLFHMDDFFLQPHQRTPERLSQPGGNVDYERFQKEILDHLKDKQGLEFHRFDCSSFSLTPLKHVPYHKIVIIEGAYSCHPYFGNVQDLKLFLESSRQGQLDRLLKRGGPEKLQMFQERWIPMEERYFETYDTKAQCVCILVDE